MGASPSIYKLGDDELVHILSCLPLDERLRASAVSRRFRGLLSSAVQLWETVSFKGVSRPLTFSALERVCRLAGDKLKTLDVREATGGDKTWLFPETNPPHVEVESEQHKWSVEASQNCRRALIHDLGAQNGVLDLFNPNGVDLSWARFDRKPTPTGAPFPDATTVRLPLSKEQNPGLARFVAWEPHAQPSEDNDVRLVLSLREATAVAHNMVQRLYFSAYVHASLVQAARVLALASSFSDASIDLVFTHFSVEDMHEDDDAEEADIDAMNELCAALRADARGFIKGLDARWLGIDNAKAASLAGAIASIASCGLRSLRLDRNYIDDEGAASVVRILMDRASRHTPLVVSMRHQKRVLSAAGRAAMMDAVAADAGANMQLRL